MEQITGQNNEFTLIFPHNRIDCISSPNDKFNKIINQANITITGNNNHISMYFDTEESAEDLLLSNGFLLIVKGDIQPACPALNTNTSGNVTGVTASTPGFAKYVTPDLLPHPLSVKNRNSPGVPAIHNPPGSDG